MIHQGIIKECKDLKIHGMNRKRRASPLAEGKSVVAAVGAGMGATIVGRDAVTSSLGWLEDKLLAIKGVAVDGGDRVVEVWRGVREAPDELWSAGAVVILVLGDAEAVALAGDDLRVAATLGDLGRLALLVGASGGQEDAVLAVVDHDGLAGHGGRSQGQDAGCDGGGEVHVEYGLFGGGGRKGLVAGAVVCA